MDKVLFIIILCFSLYSCDPSRATSYFVDNLSDYQLKVLYATYNSDTLVAVPPNTKKQFFEVAGDRGYARDLGEAFLYPFESISINISDSLVISKNFLSRSDWKFKVTGQDGIFPEGGTANYTFVVENKDIEKQIE